MLAHSNVLIPALVGALTICSAHAQARAAFPLPAGELVATCNALPASPGFVVGIIDIRDPGCDPGAVLGQNWLAPMYHNELPNPTMNPAHEWTEANLGKVFGVTLDDQNPPNIYVTATSVWGVQTGSTGRVWRLNGSTGAPSVLVDLPNTGPALGNIAYDRAHRQFFVTNHEDGRIYRVGMGGNVASTFDPFLPDDGLPGFAPLGERLWAVGVHDYRVYFSVWAEDLNRPDPGRVNAIWSVALDPASGDFNPADLTLEIQMPPYQVGGLASNPAADIAFADNDWLVVAERSMNNDASTGAHSSRVYSFSGGHLGWGPSSRVYVAGQGVQGTNATGGVDLDCPITDACNSGRLVWVMADAITLTASNYIYGVMGMPETGGGVPDSYLIDLDGDLSATNAKTNLGSLEIHRPVCTLVAEAGLPVEFCAAPPSVTLDAGASSSSNCSSAIEYRWLAGSTLLRDWSTTPTVTVFPTATTTYRLEARCGRCPCFGADSVKVTIWPDVVPGSLGNTLLQVRQGGDVMFSWGASSAAKSYVLYRSTIKSSWPPLPLRTALPTPSDRLPDVPSPPLLYFYRVAGVSCSGQEGL